ncbi:MAG: Gfo/Idh/MocA family oxidoreductase, partial [Christensenellales bacterium]|nr:Gfo/Idh/MocA family oxidoreductase [Christensenellales bacterium]
YEMVKFLLEHGRHVLCEKPLCLDPEQADELAHLAREKGLACAVNLNVRFHPACQEAKARVADPAFGPVFLVHGAYLQEFHALPAPDGWRYDEAVGGTMRAVTEIGTHWLDLAEYLTGERITSVQALFGCFQPQRMLKDGMMEPPEAAEGVPVTVCSEDSALLHFRMAGGAIGSAVLSEVSHGRTNRLSLEITGKNRSLWWDSEASTALHEASKGSGVQTALYPFGFNGFTDTFITLAARYYAALGWTFPAQQGDFPTFEDGARLAYLCRAVERSARENGVWADV